MSHTIGELVVIALKAENLPNRVARGSQDPFCVFKLGTLAKKTKIDKRGGQNPIWDDQINLAVPGGVTRLFFQIFHGQTSSENLISEGHVDLHEVLRKGEHDGFFPLIYNGNKAGRIYLELTFYANHVPTQPPPIRYVSHQYPNQRPPPPNVRPMPPPNVRPMPPPSNIRPMPPPSSNMRPNYAHPPHPPRPPVQQSVSAPTNVNHPNHRYSNVPPPPQRQQSYHAPPPPTSSASVHARHSSMPGPQPVLAAPYHPPPMSIPRPANGYPSPRPMPPQQHHSYNNNIPHSSQRPLPLTPPQPQPYYSNQPPPRQRPPY